MPHFREFIDPNFLCNLDFMDDRGNYISKVVTIKSVTKEEIHNGKGGKETVATVNTDETKPFVLSKTNMKTIVRLTRKPNTDDWTGDRIELYIAEGIKAFGNLHDVIRVRNKHIAPAEPVDYTMQREALRACTTIEDLQRVYIAMTVAEKSGCLDVKDEMKTKLQ